MECDICLIDWDLNLKIPKILPCGHTICLQCLNDMFFSAKKKQVKFLCPNCKYDLGNKIIQQSDLNNLLSNDTLISIVQKLENRRNLLEKSKFLNKTQK